GADLPDPVDALHLLLDVLRDQALDVVRAGARVERRDDDIGDLDGRLRLFGIRQVAQEPPEREQHRQHHDTGAVVYGQVGQFHRGDVLAAGCRSAVGTGRAGGREAPGGRASLPPLRAMSRTYPRVLSAPVVGASPTATASPGVTFVWPTMMTSSPAARPLVMTTRPA